MATRPLAIDLNADLGEVVDGVPTADDEAMFAVISSASIACGAHAGDAPSLREAVARAARFGVSVGAHPSYPDRANFGRTAMSLTREDLAATLAEQLAALADAAKELGADVRYVKPHGALYHAVTSDSDQAKTLVTEVIALGDRAGHAVAVLGLSGAIEREAEAAGLRFVREAFLDRGYLPDGSLVPRGEPGALLHDPAIVAARAVRLVCHGELEAVDGTSLRVDAASLCLHGDTANSVAMALAVRSALDAEGIEVTAPW